MSGHRAPRRGSAGTRQPSTLSRALKRPRRFAGSTGSGKFRCGKQNPPLTHGPPAVETGHGRNVSVRVAPCRAPLPHEVPPGRWAPTASRGRRGPRAARQLPLPPPPLQPSTKEAALIGSRGKPIGRRRGGSRPFALAQWRGGWASAQSEGRAEAGGGGRARGAAVGAAARQGAERGVPRVPLRSLAVLSAPPVPRSLLRRRWARETGGSRPFR